MDKQVSGWGMEVDPPETIHASGRVASVVGVRETIALVSRRRYFILFFVAASCVLLSIAVLSMRDTYTAASALVLERNDTQMLEAVTQLDTEQRDRSAIETEMDIISSRVFAGRVVDAMNLVNHPWFNAYLVDDFADGKESTFPGYVLGAVGSLFGLSEPDSPPKLPSISAQRDSAISALLGRMSVTRNGESLAVTVRISSPDAELSAAIANTVANVYVDWSRELKKQSMSDAVGFLRERANQVASRIAENERAITDFSGLNHLASDERDDLLRKRIDEMNTQLTSARVELAGNPREPGTRAAGNCRDGRP